MPRMRSGAGSPRCASRRRGTKRDHASQAPSYPRHPFSSGIFASAMVAAVPAVLGSYFRCRLFGLVVEVGGSPPWRSPARGIEARCLPVAFPLTSCLDQTVPDQPWVAGACRRSGNGSRARAGKFDAAGSEPRPVRRRSSRRPWPGSPTAPRTGSPLRGTRAGPRPRPRPFRQEGAGAWACVSSASLTTRRALSAGGMARYQDYPGAEYKKALVRRPK
jgi:hypothetical protein